MSWFKSLSARMRYVVMGAAAVVVIGVVLFWWLVLIPGPTDFVSGEEVALAGYHGASPTGVPAEMAHASLVARGEYLTRAADCTACHTAKGGTPYAGGLAINLPFGTIYSPNITPDKATGIGGWSDKQFIDAVRRGIGAKGEHLYPAMSYTSYAYMTDADVLAMKAYLFSLTPVNAPNKPLTFGFPFNQRWIMGIWDAFFAPSGPFEPRPAQSPEWNRGAYVAEALAHCGECHTPRNLAFALNNRSKFGGAITAGWRAYNISGDGPTGVGAWSAAELERYIASGHSEGRGTASGPMGEAVEASFRYLTPGDVHAVVTYLRSVPGVSSDLPATLAGPAPASHREPPGLDPRGKMIFAGSCASCHSWTGKSAIWGEATLTGARAVNDPTATNVAQIVIEGAEHRTANGRVFMPSFGASFSDEEVAAVANYVTARFGSEASRITPRDVAGLRKQASR
jgi:mono/diheme cytochrome c family protein